MEQPSPEAYRAPMATPYLDELLRRLRMTDPGAVISGGDVRWVRGEGRSPITIATCERDLAIAVPALGQDAREALWPDATIDDAGFNLLLVHVEEVLATRHVDVRLLINATGVVWPPA